MKKTLSPEMLHKMDAYWRAANYLSVGQIYLYDNPLFETAARARGCEAHAAGEPWAQEEPRNTNES
jgi:phosphoketolase